jgi:hypothetical protein
VPLSLTTIDAVRAVPGQFGAEDQYLQSLIWSVSDRFAAALDYRPDYAVDHEEYVVGYAGHTLTIRDHYPVISVSELYLGDTEITEVEVRQGEIYLPGGVIDTWVYSRDISHDPIGGRRQARYRVVYTGGWVTPQQVLDDPTLTRTLPHDLERAVIDQVTSELLGAGRDRSIPRKSTARGAAEWRSWVPTAEDAIYRYARVSL